MGLAFLLASASHAVDPLVRIPVLDCVLSEQRRLHYQPISLRDITVKSLGSMWDEVLDT